MQRETFTFCRTNQFYGQIDNQMSFRAHQPSFYGPSSFSLFHDNKKQQEEDRLLPSNEPLALVQPSFFPSLPPRLCEKAFMFSSVPFEHRDEAASHEQYREWEEKNFRIVHLHRCNFFNSSRVGTKFVISENLFPDSKMISEFIQRISFFFFLQNTINIFYP